jgi:hypothetical protein
MNFTTIVQSKMKLFPQTFSLREFPRKVLCGICLQKKFFVSLRLLADFLASGMNSYTYEFFAIALYTAKEEVVGTSLDIIVKLYSLHQPESRQSTMYNSFVSFFCERESQ